MEVKINKEIREYTETVFFGLSLRQFCFSAAACIAAAVLFFLFRKRLGTQMLSWICILGALPMALFGFIRYHGMNLEEFLWVWLKSEILMPQRLLPCNTNIFYHAFRPLIGELQKSRKEIPEDADKTEDSKTRDRTGEKGGVEHVDQGDA